MQSQVVCQVTLVLDFIGRTFCSGRISMSRRGSSDHTTKEHTVNDMGRVTEPTMAIKSLLLFPKSWVGALSVGPM